MGMSAMTSTAGRLRRPRRAWQLLVCAVLLLGGCTRMSRALYLSGCDREIRNAARAIETARDAVERAAGHARRGSAYSEKARSSRCFKLIAAEEYLRQFRLALDDHDQAVRLDPGSAEAYYRRGRTYYDRASLEAVGLARPWFDSAAADFTKAVERDRRHDLAWDMLGVVHMSTGELDKAIDAFTHEMALVPLGRSRLADAYCSRGSFHQKEKRDQAAIADFEKAIEVGVTGDGCSCDPYNPLIWLYVDSTHQYDKAWDVVHKARKSRRFVAPELVAALEKASERKS
jgi:tetratricopeptide (TPR) repeat protein